MVQCVYCEAGSTCPTPVVSSNYSSTQGKSLSPQIHHPCRKTGILLRHSTVYSTSTTILTGWGIGCLRSPTFFGRSSINGLDKLENPMEGGESPAIVAQSISAAPAWLGT